MRYLPRRKAPSHVSTILPVFCHGPKASVAPDGTIVLFHIGTASDPPSRICNCAAANGSEAACTQLSPPGLTDPRDGRGYITYATAKPGAWDGPFTPVGAPVLEPQGRWEGWLSNPSAAVFQSNGSFFLAYRSWARLNTTEGAAPSKEEFIFIATSAAIGAPIVRVRALPIGIGEDPAFFTDPRGGLHMLSHLFCGCGHGHSYSPPGDPSFWTTMPHAVGCDVTWVNGTKSTVHRRERPQLLFDVSGTPIVLFSGVQPLPSDVTDFSFTMANKIAS